MSGGSRGAWAVVLGSVFTAVACGIWPTFPDSRLRPARDGGILTDSGSPKDTPAPTDTEGMDAEVTDVLVPDGPGEDLDDGAPMDALDDVELPPVDADLCAIVPVSAVSARRVSDGVPGAHDLTVDALGRIVVGLSRRVDVLDPGDGGAGALTPLVTGLAGEVRALRFTGNGLLALSLELAVDGGDPDGNISVASALGGPGEPRVERVSRPGGLAVDSENGVWFSNTSTGRVLRFVPTALGAGARDGGTAVPASLVTDVNAPTLLAFSADGTMLYIANTLGTLFRVSVAREMGALTVGTSVALVGGLGNISGLALDTCGNAYVSDVSRDVIRRVNALGVVTPLVTNVAQPRGLAFGQGMRLSRSTLYTLSAADGSLHAIDTVAQGVVLPSP